MPPTQNNRRPKHASPQHSTERATNSQTTTALASDESLDDNGKEIASRDIVLNSAQTLIMQHGFAGLSMRELAKESGIAKGTIYYHFQDKRHIYLSVLERDINQVRDRLLVAVEQDGDFIHKLRLLIQTYFDLQRERRLVIMSALRENTVLGDKFSEILKKYRTELLQPIGALIREGMATGMVRPVDVELTVLSLLGILQGFVVHQLILENADIDNNVIDHIVSQFAHGIMVQGNSMLPTSESSTSGGCTS